MNRQFLHVASCSTYITSVATCVASCWIVTVKVTSWMISDWHALNAWRKWVRNARNAARRSSMSMCGWVGECFTETASSALDVIKSWMMDSLKTSMVDCSTKTVYGVKCLWTTLLKIMIMLCSLVTNLSFLRWPEAKLVFIIWSAHACKNPDLFPVSRTLRTLAFIVNTQSYQQASIKYTFQLYHYWLQKLISFHS